MQSHSVTDDEKTVWFLFLFPLPSPSFDRHSPLWYKFISLPSLPLLLKSKMEALIFTNKILSTHSSKSPGSAGLLIPTSVTPVHSTRTCMMLIMVTYLMLVSDFFLLCQDKRGLALDGKLKHEDTNLASSTMWVELSPHILINSKLVLHPFWNHLWSL